VKIAIAAAEIAPHAKAGGLADVIGAMPPALQAAGTEPSVIVPAYPPLLHALGSVPIAGEMSMQLGPDTERFSVRGPKLSRGVSMYLIEHPHFFARNGIYGDAGGAYSDNLRRFIFFGRAAAMVAAEMIHPDVIHAHDWHSAATIIAARADDSLRRHFERTLAIFTIHNVAFQGLADGGEFHLLGIDRKYFNPGCLEFYGLLNLMKGAIVLADGVSTVSPTYAREVTGSYEFGFGLEGVLSAKGGDFIGILNGADYDEWDPAHDSNIAARYSAMRPDGKRECARALRAESGFPEREGTPIIGMVTRMTEQKGVYLLRDALDEVMRMDVQLVMLAAGDPPLEGFFRDAERRYPGKFHSMIEFDDAAAHRVQAGSDAFLMPSRFEPCGLTQMYALRYGTAPIVRATGGLRDTVSEFDPATGAGNGFVFERFEPWDMVAAITRMTETFRNPPAWRRLIENCFAANFSWDRAARTYLEWFVRLRSARRLE